MSTEPSKMTVLDNTDLNGIIQDATGEPLDAVEEKPVETPAEAKAEDDPESDFPPELKEQLTTSMKKTIGKKHRQAKEAEEFAQDQYNQRLMAERRAQELEERLRRYEQQTQPDQPQGPQKPDRNQFETDEAYQDALVDYRVELRLQRQEQERIQAEQQAAFEEMARQAESRIASARKLKDDFDEVVGSSEIQIPPAIANYMQASPMIAELGYHFATHPDLVDKLSQMNPMKQLVEIGKIEAILKPFEEKSPKASNGEKPSHSGEEKSKPTNGRSPRQAPAPITPLNTASGIHEVDESGLDYKAARERWAAKNRVNITRRARH